MELWVRSQDKETLMKVNRIDVENNNVICYDNDYRCNETYMGLYKSKERALEILDEIQNILNPRLTAILKTSDEMNDLVKNVINEHIEITKQEVEIEELSTYVYEMPED